MFIKEFLTTYVLQIKNGLRRFFRYFFVKIFPELNPIVKGNVNLNWISDQFRKNEIEDSVKIYSPYNVTECKIGKGTYIASNAKISKTKIGRFCSIGPNLLCGWGIHPVNGLSTNPYFYSTLKQNGETLSKVDLISEREEIVIGHDVFIGANVTILDGVNIGNGAIIGAGAVVSKDIPEYAIAVGVPIQIKKYRFSKVQQEKLNKICWWNFDDSKLKKVNEYFFDIDNFVNDMLEENDKDDNEKK